jgi:opacity protein-like surface antigen
VSGRLIYDITEQVDLGLNVSFMSGRSRSQQGSSVQKGIGVEVGYSMTSNLWASLGYNFTGYTDKDLTSDYTGRGAYLRLRYKFDQDVFQYNNPKINNTLER